MGELLFVSEQLFSHFVLKSKILVVKLALFIYFLLGCITVRYCLLSIPYLDEMLNKMLARVFIFVITSNELIFICLL